MFGSTFAADKSVADAFNMLRFLTNIGAQVTRDVVVLLQPSHKRGRISDWPLSITTIALRRMQSMSCDLKMPERCDTRPQRILYILFPEPLEECRAHRMRSLPSIEGLAPAWPVRYRPTDVPFEI